MQIYYHFWKTDQVGDGKFEYPFFWLLEQSWAKMRSLSESTSKVNLVKFRVLRGEIKKWESAWKVTLFKQFGKEILQYLLISSIIIGSEKNGYSTRKNSHFILKNKSWFFRGKFNGKQMVSFMGKEAGYFITILPTTG